jgi:hypothetical protein
VSVRPSLCNDPNPLAEGADKVRLDQLLGCPFESLLFGVLVVAGADPTGIAGLAPRALGDTSID